MKRNENIWNAFNADSYQSQYRLANGNTKNMIITEVEQAMLLTQGSWNEVRDGLIAYIEYKLDLTETRWNPGEKHE